MIQTVLLSFVVAALAVPYPSLPQFLLKSSSPAPAFDALYVSSYHFAAGASYAVLTSNNTLASKMFLNGTQQQLATNQGYLQEVTGNVPYTLQVSGISNLEDRKYVNWIAGEQTSGLYLSQCGHLEYSNKTWDGWYACPEKLIYGPAIEIFWNQQGQKTPAGCGDVDLAPEYLP